MRQKHLEMQKGEKMRRLIDADELMEFIENRYEITWESNSYEGGIKDACVDILEKIKNMPTCEMLKTKPSAQPERKPGRWIYWDDEPEHNAYECSECKKPIVLISGTPTDNGYKFCPGCGLSMKGTTSYYKLHGKKDD